MKTLLLVLMHPLTRTVISAVVNLIIAIIQPVRTPPGPMPA